MRIWGNTLVKNEEKYLWYAVNSAIQHLDKVLIWDTGSTDQTPEIIKELKKAYPKKIEARFLGDVDIHKFTEVRNEMLKLTKADWLMILDGDEVWWENSIVKTVEVISRNRSIESIVTPYKNVIGDVYHFQEEKAGKYKIDGNQGHLTIRFIKRNIEGLRISKPHGVQGFFDKKGILIQERSKKNRKHQSDTGFLHFTHMRRSRGIHDKKVPKRIKKYKHEIGIPFPFDFFYPEVFFQSRPEIVPNVWEKMEDAYRYKALINSYPRKLKRRVWRMGSGY